LKMELPEESIR